MDIDSKDIERKFLEALKAELPSHYTQSQLYKAVVNTPFNDPLTATYLSLGIVVLLLVNEKIGTIDRVALSETVHAQGATRTSEKEFREIIIPLNNKENIIAKAIQTGNTQITEDWKYLFTPALEALSARFNQASAGIEYSLVVPFKNKHNSGAMIFSFFKHSDNAQSVHKVAEDYTKHVAVKLSATSNLR